ncbi:hypothetical protein FRACYDRAFT_268467 [Fragilariopsis cylindrus CCMP1102]|uniref:Uncharacterized protein n=1 Tax=Fragilariopsis cylindrus CCMP1102 TaxID=635003 RepID=A0A1E7FL24_9STRA|nr:hypothetical protein FRACYDRAFT_268467 [Fragilariopsis cylindrus CCMP1102]|eukprot:OEU18846.1 hypothetical protein FRACYDRAFT_268467 [Fragilariopsis cylindrus CCMP1102]
MEPSRFSFHLLTVGTPSGATITAGTFFCFFLPAFFLGTALVAAGCGRGGNPSSTAPKPSPKSENVALGVAFSMAFTALLASFCFRS